MNKVEVADFKDDGWNTSRTGQFKNTERTRRMADPPGADMNSLG